MIEDEIREAPMELPEEPAEPIALNDQKTVDQVIDVEMNSEVVTPAEVDANQKWIDWLGNIDRATPVVSVTPEASATTSQPTTLPEEVPDEFALQAPPTVEASKKGSVEANFTYDEERRMLGLIDELPEDLKGKPLDEAKEELIEDLTNSGVDPKTAEAEVNKRFTFMDQMREVLRQTLSMGEEDFSKWIANVDLMEFLQFALGVGSGRGAGLSRERGEASKPMGIEELMKFHLKKADGTMNLNKFSSMMRSTLEKHGLNVGDETLLEAGKKSTESKKAFKAFFERYIQDVKQLSEEKIHGELTNGIAYWLVNNENMSEESLNLALDKKTLVEQLEYIQKEFDMLFPDTQWAAAPQPTTAATAAA